jgi:membrane-associated phospholipid phosphatase
VFPEYLRPVAYFRELGVDIYTIAGLDIPLHYSFPSGHSASAFAIFVGISFLVKLWYWKVILLLIAIIAGFSRIYLAMHFPVDVIAGSLVGVLTTFICFIWISGWKKQWLDVSLATRILK